MKMFALSLALALALVACSTPEGAPPVYEGPFASSKIGLDVKRITMADRSGLTADNSPYYNNSLTPTIAEAIKQWAMDRLQATGQVGQANVIVRKASLVSQPLPMKDGFESWFTRQQAIKFVANAEVSVEVSGHLGYAVADATATRSVTLPENPTAHEKQEAYIAMLDELMKDLGQNLESSIHSHLANFIATAPMLGTTAVPLESAQPKADAARAVEPINQPLAAKPSVAKNVSSDNGGGAPLELVPPGR